MCYGISIYLSESDTFNESWIEKAAKYGFQYIFTSLHIPEEKEVSFKEKVKKLGSWAQNAHMEVMADISPASLERLGLNFDELPVLQDWGITGVRTDYGFSDKQIAKLSQSLKIGLNASTIDEGQLKNLLDLGLEVKNTEAWHNFYPKPYTGISKKALNLRNELFHRYGIKTMAFIPGDDRLRGPLEEKLPTIEEHRSFTPLHSALELKSLGTDKVCVGDISLSDSSLMDIQHVTEECIPLYVSLKEGYKKLYNTVQENRLDASEYVVRSSATRDSVQLYEPESYNGKTFKRGVITIDNKRYGRYAGELQILLTELPASEKMNVAGEVSESSVPLLDFIGSGQKFIFLPEKETERRT